MLKTVSVEEGSLSVTDEHSKAGLSIIDIESRMRNAVPPPNVLSDM